jgi:hypothetical protein
MTGARWFLLSAFGLSVILALRMMSLVLPCRRPDDLADPKGEAFPAILYSLTWAMAPWKKESARMHPYVYTLGVAYHVGIFLGFFWLAALFIQLKMPAPVVSLSTAYLALATLCGLILLTRRIVSRELRYFSGPDDYLSNCVVTGFLALAALSLHYPGTHQVLFIYGGLLLLYIPVGKLRHAIYFLPARLYLGLFYGRRGVWPAKDKGAGRA